MEIILAIDLKNGCIVHGKSGQRDSYTPLNWGLAGTCDPLNLIRKYRPKFLYIADLDRIEGKGDNYNIACKCAELVCECFYDAGIKRPDGIPPKNKNILNVIGTETCGEDLGVYNGNILSIDIKEGKVIPCGKDPAEILSEAEKIGFPGCIILDISSVGTGYGIMIANLMEMRKTFKGRLLYGGGVQNTDDLKKLSLAGFDGVILATAIHKGIIPVSLLESGFQCL